MLEGIVSKRSIVTFASHTYRHTHARFLQQAREIGVFDEYLLWTEEDLDEDFRKEFSLLLKTRVRGFGYWVWKPQVILQALRRLHWGDSLIYLDSGSHIVSSGRARLLEYLQLAEAHPKGILAFQMTLPEREWTKRDLLHFFNVTNNSEVLESGQVQAGAIVMSKTPESVAFMERWLAVFRAEPGLVDDSPSSIGEAEYFKEHRHDQSVFSLMAKLESIALQSASEQYPEPPSTWSDLTAFPLHHRRDTVRDTLYRRAAPRVRKGILPFQVFLVKAKRRLIALAVGRAP